MSPRDVVGQLERIVESDEFHASDRNRSFLRYVTDETLAGREVGIKAYTIACNVFGRPEGFDSARDPIVRIEAGKLRKALERYYLTAGVTDPIRIEIPKGSYVPTFRPSHEEPAEAPSARVEGGVPTIAVLPFALLGEDPAQSHFATGLSAEIAAALSHYQNVAVTSRYSAISVESHANLVDIRNELNARFVLEGIVRRSRDRMRMTVQLTDVETQRQIWGETYDRSLSAENLFDVEDDIVRRVVEAVASLYGGAISEAVYKESRQRRPTELSAYEAVLHVHHHNQLTTPERFFEAKAALEQAVEIEPEYAEAWAALGEIRCDAYTLGYVDDLASVREGLEHARKARTLDPRSEQAHFVEGLGHLALRDRAGVERAADALLARSASPATLAWGGWLLALIGDWDRGLGILHPQLEVLPGYPAWLHHAPFLYHYRRHEYEAALSCSLKFRQPELFWDPIDRAAVLGQLGHVSEAGKALAEIASLQPKFADDPRRFLSCFIFQDELVEHVLEGLVKAGL